MKMRTQPIPVDVTSLAAVASGLPPTMRAALRFAQRIERGSLVVWLPDGRGLRFAGPHPGPTGEIVIRDMRLARRFIFGGDVGIGEAYIRGEWDSPNVAAFLEVFAANQPMIQNLLSKNPFARLFLRLQHEMRRNSRRGARRNISSHYDLGNAFYGAWLDPGLTYSSAVFAEGDNDLESAQRRKYRLLAERTGVRADHHVLEIGCGWGSFATFLATEIGSSVTALTISRAQYEHAARRIQALGLSERVNVALRDYRDERGSYDRVVSVEMFEAVGERFWPVFFRQVHDRLLPGGRVGMQVITIPEPVFENYRRSIDFIRRHVFPGGMLPSPERLRSAGAAAGLMPGEETAFGGDYAATLRAWRDRFAANWPSLMTLGFDERFRRLWHYYLCYCEAGFAAGAIDVRQVVFARPH